MAHALVKEPHFISSVVNRYYYLINLSIFFVRQKPFVSIH